MDVMYMQCPLKLVKKWEHLLARYTSCCIHNCFLLLSGILFLCLQNKTFPEIEAKRDRWLSSLKIMPDGITKRSVICSEHFRDDDFLVDDKSGRRRLKPSAVPILLDDHLSGSENEDYVVEEYSDPVKTQVTSETKTLEIAVLNFKNTDCPDEDFYVERRETTSTKPDEYINDGEEKIDTAERLNTLEVKVKVLKQTINERNRMIKSLKSKLQMRNRKMRYWVMKYAKLKKQRKLQKKEETELSQLRAYFDEA